MRYKIFQPQSERLIQLFSGFLCLLLVAVGFYLQISRHLLLCPLCGAQRFLFLILGFLFLLGGLLPFIGWQRMIHRLLTLAFATIGIVLAGRQVWLEHLPSDQQPLCSPGILYLLKILPWDKALSIFILGTGSCARVGFRLLYLSIPQWSLIFFVLFALINLWQICRVSRPNSVLH